MANTLISGDDSVYGFNLEWIAAGSGIGEEICGVDKDCIVVPSSPVLNEIGLSNQQDLVDNYVEIEVTEEEVVSDHWVTSQHNGSITDGIGFSMDGSHGDDIHLPDDQDEYSRLHPYPCDFCSRRFSKKSALSSHMVTHQIEKQHVCNMCGAMYQWKHDLVEHMKIHAYVPDIKLSPDEDDYENISTLPQAKAKQKARKKKKYPKTSFLDVMDDVKPPRKSKKNSPLPSSMYSSYLEEPPEEEKYQIEPKYPIIDPSRPYVCQYCGVGFAREKALISHNMIHVGDSTFECDKCQDIFHSEEQFNEHVNTMHARYQRPSERLGSFRCDKCPLVFQWYNQLRKHRKTHSMIKLEEEEVVTSYEEQPPEIHGYLPAKENVMDNEALVYEHEEDMGLNLKSRHKPGFACAFCDRAFKDAKSLSKHSLTHMEGKTYPCNVCHRRFHNKYKLKKHMSTHEETKKGLTCNECGADFPDGRTLIDHKTDAHNLNLFRLFPCIECGKTFNSRSSQQIHVRIHTGEKPYGCRFCWKAFGDGGTLRKHERIHTGEKPYVCPVCSKAFNQRVVLREHVRAHHSGGECKVADNYYICLVCTETFTNSQDLCLHLVHHSDENTAKHRLNTNRRYTKRRKIFTPPPNRYSFLETEEVDGYEEEEKKCILPPPSQEIIHPESKLNESPIDTMNFLLEKPPPTVGESPKKARIVRSGKKGVPKGQNKRYLKGKGKAAARLLNNTTYASKYVVTHNDLNSLYDPLSLAGSSVIDTPPPSNEEIPFRSRPRTKNVSYHNMKAERFEVATFPLPFPPLDDDKSEIPELPSVKIKQEVLDPIDTQFINGIDPSFFEETHTSEEIETCIVDDIGVELKLEVKTSDTDELVSRTDNNMIFLNTEFVSCDMCSEVFTSRSDLLKHIQIHI